MSMIEQVKDIASSTARHALWQVLWAGVVGYFVYHAVYGERGFFALSHLQGEIDQAEAVLSEVRAQRQSMEYRASLMRPDGLDPDMLDERARVVLNYSHPDEVVILLPRGSVAPPVVAVPQGPLNR